VRDAAVPVAAAGGFLADEAADLDGGLRWLPAGDRFVLLELGTAMELGLNLRAIQLANRLLEERTPGLIETLPMFISVLVHFDSTVLSPARLRDRVAAVWREVSAESDVVVPSRLIEVPACYGDPWTRDCVADYASKVKPIGDDAAYVAEISGLPDAGAFARRHASPSTGSAASASGPGCPT
jgi:urea carboxylase